jgi:guanylate kinase
MLVLSAPSGTGKTTLAKRILEEDEHINLSISSTTRPKRPNEIDKKHYFFTSKKQFKQDIADDKFLEHAEIYNEFYGTPKKDVLDKLEEGIDVLFDIDWQGHRQLCATARDDVTSVFILPPSKAELYSRLCKRNQDEKKIIDHRMSRANEEISYWYHYDYVIINRDIDQSTSKLLSILKAERLKKERRTGLNNFIGHLITQKI